MWPITGGSFTGLTSRLKVAVALAPSPSVTVTVIDAVPEAFATGTARKDRLPPVPVTTNVSFGINDVSPEVAETVKASAGPSGSDTLNGISIGMSSGVV